MPMDCPWDAHGMHMGMPIVCPWDAHGMPMGCPWDDHDMPMGRPWAVRGLPMVDRWLVPFGWGWAACGLPVRCPWAVRWAVRGMPMGCSWDARGTVSYRRFIKKTNNIGLPGWFLATARKNVRPQNPGQNEKRHHIFEKKVFRDSKRYIGIPLSIMLYPQ